MKYIKKIVKILFISLNARYLLSSISPRIASKVFYYLEHKKKLDLNNPKNFKEKLMWLKLNLYNNNSIVKTCADKYKVYDYLKEQNYSHILNDLLYVWEDENKIEWDKLPQKFALKCNHGCGYNIICDDKSKLDIKMTMRTLNKWLIDDFWKKHAEVHYKDIPKKIICEKFIENKDGTFPYDYKIYCFNGKPKTILFTSNREQGDSRIGIFMSLDWEFISVATNRNSRYVKPDILPPKPKNLEQMINIAEDLSKPFPFVRIDFYEVEDRLIFGEFTFTPGACIWTSETYINGKTMGEILEIPV